MFNVMEVYQKKEKVHTIRRSIVCSGNSLECLEEADAQEIGGAVNREEEDPEYMVTSLARIFDRSAYDKLGLKNVATLSLEPNGVRRRLRASSACRSGASRFWSSKDS
ncbi:hypothetical protein DXG03_008659 [Asterophora parasitica]|uniref:Uncharacterized protein n=1 Tax=Asterophora parasitica TaxID=117018 RepID=A0A9P7GBV0_9AGAR|nr:hypothetical protein DXG03_008659 [Asterophora parasitica]